jgi:hypothetical protein
MFSLETIITRCLIHDTDSISHFFYLFNFTSHKRNIKRIAFFILTIVDVNLIMSLEYERCVTM